jgi:hypothetical protein
VAVMMARSPCVMTSTALAAALLLHTASGVKCGGQAPAGCSVWAQAEGCSICCRLAAMAGRAWRARGCRWLCSAAGQSASGCAYEG